MDCFCKYEDLNLLYAIFLQSWWLPIALKCWQMRLPQQCHDTKQGYEPRRPLRNSEDFKDTEG